MATFTPSIVLDPNTGEEIVSYDHGIFDSGEGRNAAIADHMHSHQAQYVTDHDGRVHHEWSDLDPSRYQQYEEDYVDPDEYSAQFDNLEVTPQDLEYLQDIAGGSELYADLVLWAADNLTEDEIEFYDSVMESGDVENMESLVRWLIEARDLDGAVEWDSDDLELEEYDDFTSQVFASIPNYGAILDWAASTLRSEAINEYDSVMANGTHDQRVFYIQRLVELYNGAK